MTCAERLIGVGVPNAAPLLKFTPNRRWNQQIGFADERVVLALSIRQPYAELILRGIKTVEYRSRRTHRIGERFWIYVSQSRDEVRRMKDEADAARKIWSNDLAVPGPKSGDRPAWLMELAELLVLDKLPRGLIVGSAIVERVSGPIQSSSLRLPPYYQWHLAGVERAKTLRKPVNHPQPAWFRPF